MKNIQERLEYLRRELRAERISTGELVELQSYTEHIIESGDMELMEAAGVPEPHINNFALGANDAAN